MCNKTQAFNGGIVTPKNVTIYLSDEIAGKMEKYPEVNWSEICRKAVTDYIDTRSQIDIASLLEKLKAESNEAYKQGQILFYQIAPKMSLKEFDIWYPHVSGTISDIGESIAPADSPPPSPITIYRAIRGMQHMMGGFCRDNSIVYPSDAPDAFWEGAISAFVNVYTKIRPKKIDYINTDQKKSSL